MAGKFQVGDLVVANEESNYHYSITNQRNNWRGEVMDTYSDVITVRGSGNSGEIETFDVSEKYFDLIVEDAGSVEAPEMSVFDGLF